MTSAIDQCAADAVELARAAALDEADAETVGAHLEVVADDDLVVTHLFDCRAPGYVGWRWAVTLTRSPESDKITVDEVVLLPGPQSLLAPQWVPFDARVQPGDLGVGDVLPAAPDDRRLVPGYVVDWTSWPSDPQPAGWEVGLGRERVVSARGRGEAARRWRDGDRGPDTAMARAAGAHCATCGFAVLLSGPLGQAFGVCANSHSPADGEVVALDFGCGAHSEGSAAEEVLADPAAPILDETGYDHFDTGDDSGQFEAGTAPAATDPIDAGDTHSEGEHATLVVPEADSADTSTETQEDTQ